MWNHAFYEYIYKSEEISFSSSLEIISSAFMNNEDHSNDKKTQKIIFYRFEDDEICFPSGYQGEDIMVEKVA